MLPGLVFILMCQNLDIVAIDVLVSAKFVHAMLV